MIKLSRREKTLLKILAVLVVILGIYLLVISPFLKFQENSENDLKNNLENLNRIDTIYSEYKDIRNRKTEITSLLNRKDENITSSIEQWANSTGIARNIAYTRRSQSNIQNKFIRITTDVKFEGVPIEKLLRFIYEIENSNKLIKFSYIRIHQGLKGTNKYDVIIKIDSFTAQ